MDSLEAISPLDGRYRRHIEPLANIFSEQGLIRSRVRVEGEYLLALSEHPQIKTRLFTEDERSLIRKLYDVCLDDAKIVKALETKGYGNIKATNHDVKAVEYFMQHQLKGTSLEDSLAWIHFALTSEDVNTIAYGLMLSDGCGIILPVLEELCNSIENFGFVSKDIPLLARTHGQPATPTTFGKELHVFSSRLQRQLNQLNSFELLVKLNGATGNYNAHTVAYPDVNWTGFTQDFISRFNHERVVKLVPNLITTQIEPHDTYAELSDLFRRVNTILIDLDQDLWRYISDDWLTQKAVSGEVGSSTMPHKVNPIDFENSEGNLGLANALFTYFSTKLPISRLQRDLSDSTVLRNFGVAFGHSLVGYRSLQKGLGKVSINEPQIRKVLKDHPEIISEAFQTILRREGMDLAYETLKNLTRGKKITLDDFKLFVDGLNISDTVKQELYGITPFNYIGLASYLATQ